MFQSALRFAVVSDSAYKWEEGALAGFNPL